ncbi:MAG: hypothetical protein HYX67_06395 [Candidatus Melainabacteria bacterium]|nr:hypothetical protein [Candidatus Melainabacteria bacterium]
MKFLVSLSILVTLTTIELACAALPAPAQSASRVKALELKQTHYFFGTVEITATKTAIRMEDTGSWKFVLVAKAPDWKVTVFRNDDKLYFTCPLKTFLDGGMVSQLLVGKKAPSFGVGHEEPTNLIIGGVKAKKLTARYALCEYLPTETLVAPQVTQIIYETMRMPMNGGICLRFVQLKQGVDWMTGLKDYGQHIMLSTQSQKMITVPSTIFDAPVGYKKSKSLREVLISNESRESSTDARDLFEINK